VSSKETTSIVQKQRDYSDIVKLYDSDAMTAFLQEPASFIADTLTGLMGSGKAELLVAGGRIAHAAFKTRVFAQWGDEIKRLREKGKLADEYANTTYGFQTWVELFTLLDSEIPDPERLDALKAMFFSVNKAGISDRDQIAVYQLWQITKSLSSGELLLLKAVYEQRDTYQKIATNYSTWRTNMAAASGHMLESLVDLYEEKVVSLNLLSPRLMPDRSRIDTTNGRLTDLGLRLCKNIETYRIALRETGS